ncbi:MAG TPA: phosphoribosyltransferase family protein [Chitinophagaceae bacterium]|nr:phosphoribosyltransferase family protein [Chitinophagaceae bacterium]
MFFKNRFDAAVQLAPLLNKYKHQAAVIMAIPRGGVPIGYYLARYLDLPLDLLMAKKLGHPANPEYAIGAVSLEGSIAEDCFDIPEKYILDETKRIREQLKLRYKQFMGDKEPVDIKGRIVIVTDDGIATGRTILSVIKILRNKQPAKIVVAVPVSSEKAAERIRTVVDEFICLQTPYPFFAIGNFYEDFSQVEDDEVIQLLQELKAIDKVG